MDSVHGTKTVRLHRKKSGLDFSVKGGQEHGIPIVVSWIKDNGAAAKHLRLGDVILAVNGRSLQGTSHSEAVARLKQAGTNVLLRIKPSQVYEDVFSMGKEKVSSSEAEETTTPDSPWLGHAHTGPLPTGWEKKMDIRTGRPYYENHYTETTSWTDPRSLQPVPLQEFDWKSLPPSWERQLTDQGDIYYVCHDTQNTHWDSPRGMRLQQQLKEMSVFLQHQRQLLKVKETELKRKREFLLEKNTTLGTLPNTTVDNFQSETTESCDTTKVVEGDGEVGESPADVINDIMSLNEEVVVLDEDVTLIRNQLKELAEIVSHAQYEDIGEEDEYEAAAKLSAELLSDYHHFKSIENKLHKIIQSFEELRQERGFSDTPLQYMMQLPPLRTGQGDKGKEMRGVGQEVWFHTLPDRLTGKTNCEMRVERCLLQEMMRYAEELLQRLASMYGRAMTSHGSGWSQVIKELAGVDFTPLQDQWLLEGCTLQEKLDKLVPQD